METSIISELSSPDRKIKVLDTLVQSLMKLSNGDAFKEAD